MDSNKTKKSSGNKKWIAIFVMALLLIICEGVVLVMFVWPQYNISSLISAIEDEDQNKAQKAADRIYDNYEDKAKDVVNDYSANLCMKYEKSEVEFSKLLGAFEILQEIELTNEIGNKYLNQISEIEINKLINNLAKAYLEGDYDAVSDYDTEINEIYDSMNKDEFYNVISEITQKAFTEYLDDTSDFDYTLQVFDRCLRYADYSIQEDVDDYIMRVYLISDYRDKYDVCEELLENESYIEICKKIDNIVVDKDDTIYADLFDEMYNNAYDTGLTYYVEKATNLASGNDKTKAKEMVEAAKEYYGDNIDMSSVEALLVDPWMKAYDDYLDNWEENLKTDLGNNESGSYLLENGWDSGDFTPDKIFLYDIDGNNTPELFLWIDNGNEANSCYIIGFDGKDTVFLGFYDILYFAKESQIICGASSIEALGRGTGEEYYLYQLSSNQFVQTGDCTYWPTSQSYTVDGVEATIEDYNNRIEEFKALAKNEDATTVESVNINEHSDFILEYK